jgi:hypothetical protein
MLAQVLHFSLNVGQAVVPFLVGFAIGLIVGLRRGG